MSNSKLIVQKYGGATLADPDKIKQVAKRIFDLHKSGSKIVVIVSAMGQTTNQLIELAQQVSSRPSLRELDMLLTVGERISMSLLSMALNDLGCSAISFTGSQAGIITDDSHVSANIIDVKAFRVVEALKENKVVILAGFQGVSLNTKEITTLGRGGSDISAVAMAGYLKADCCEILKDVDCIYTADPKLVKSARPISQLNYQHLLEMTSWGAKVLHHRSVKLAEEKQVILFVGPAANSQSNGTTVSNNTTFSSQCILAINSFSLLFQLNFKNDSPEEIQKNFHTHLRQNQIGQLDFLFSKSEKQQTSHYFTAPLETLNSLKEFENRQNYFKITNADLASVSVTFAKPTEEKDLLRIKALLIKNSIEVLESFQISNSLHFFVNTHQKNEAVQFLHNLI